MKAYLRSLSASLFTLLIVFFLSALVLSGLVGCGKANTVDADGRESTEGDELEDTQPSEEPDGASYVEGQIEMWLDTDLLWSEGRGDMDPKGEQMQAAIGKIYELAARYGCTVESYEFYGPYEGAMVVMGLPEGKDEEEAITEFLEEPLVHDASRVEATSS